MRIRHKGLRALHERDDAARLPPVSCHGSGVSCSGCKRRRIRAMPTLRASGCIPLKGDRAGQWSVRVSGNWRVVFRFEDGEAADVDLIDYH